MSVSAIDLSWPVIGDSAGFVAEPSWLPMTSWLHALIHQRTYRSVFRLMIENVPAEFQINGHAVPVKTLATVLRFVPQNPKK